MAASDLLRVFGALQAARVRYLVVGGVAVALPDLIALKRAAGRPKDLQDVEALAAILAEDADG